MNRIIAVALFLMVVSTVTVCGQTGSVNDTIPSWHAGLNVRKMLQSLRNKAWVPFGGQQHNIFSMEVKAYLETSAPIRPAFRLGYREYDFNSEKKEINSRGIYGKAGLEWVFNRREHNNQAVGVHGLISHIWENNSLEVGNDYFGYISKPYVHRVWMPALELNYVYTAQVVPRLSIQLEAFVSVYGQKDQYRQLGQLPGVARLLDGAVHFFYQLY